MSYAGSNVTGTDGLVAVDKVGNRIRFYDPQTLREISGFAGPEPCVHELADRARSHDGVRAALRRRHLRRQQEPQQQDPGDRSGAARTRGHHPARRVRRAARHGGGDATASCGSSATSPTSCLLVDPQKRAVEAAYDCPSHGPHVLTLTPDGTRIYVSCKEGPWRCSTSRTRKFMRQFRLARRAIDQRQWQRQRRGNADAGRAPSAGDRQRPQRPPRHRHRAGPRDRSRPADRQVRSPM